MKKSGIKAGTAYFSFRYTQAEAQDAAEIGLHGLDGKKGDDDGKE